MSTLERAIAIAAEAHAGQLDKAGEPYILHPLRVMLAMRSEVGRIVGVLHDVIEDSPEGPEAAHERISAARFRGEVILALGFLYRPKRGLSYETYIDRLSRLAPSVAVAVKVSDLRDNLSADRMRCLDDPDIERFTRKYLPALHRLTQARNLEGI